MHFLKSKKGDSTEMSLAHILDIGLVALAILLLTSFVYKASSGEFIEEKKIALNTGILIDTMFSANGNTFISVDIANNTIKITERGVETGNEWMQFFHILEKKDTKIISDDISFKDIENIKILKTGNKMYIGENITKKSSLSCPFVFIETPNNAAILPENEFRLERSLNNALGSQITIIRTNSLNENTELAIMLNSSSGTSFKVEIPPNSIESRRLACAMTNELQIDNPELKTEIVVVENELFQNSKIATILTMTPELNNDINTFNALSNALKSTFT
jgi:hypothetical protein